MLIGVYGANDGLENTPNSSPGVLLPPPKPRVSDLLVQQRARKLGIPAIAGHRAVLTQRLDHKRLPKLLHPGNAKAQTILAADMQKRAACFCATPCGRGCSIRANYQSTTVHLPPALDTGNLDIVTDAMVRAVTKRKDGKAEGVIYIDRKTGAEHRVKARIVVLAASALESVRILLNSGVANCSGKVGKYIMDTVGANFSGQVPAAREPAAAQRGRRRRPAPVHAVVAVQGATRGQARLRARLSLRVRWRAPACPTWAPPRVSSG